MKLDYMKHGFFASLVLLLFTSCFKEEPKNMECDILEAWVEGESYAAYFFNSADMRVLDVPSNEQKVEFTVRSQATLPALPVHFKLSPGATIVPGDGTEQDFSKGPVTYTVTSEDGEWSRQYTVSFRNPPTPPLVGNTMKFDFENYSLDENGKYYVWYEKGDDGAKSEIWASGNAGFMMSKQNAAPDAYPSVPDPNGYEGSCLKLTTCDTGSWGKKFKKPIAAGSVFLGEFDSQYALTKTLWTTKMGIPFTEEPVKVTGYYKYTPGEKFTNEKGETLGGRVDEPNLYAVFYYNKDESGAVAVLHGDDVMSSPRIVSIAQQASFPATTEWTKFELTFAGDKPIDATQLANRDYSLALVFSSSREGDMFMGAVGSTLYVDKVEITFKPKEE